MAPETDERWEAAEEGAELLGEGFVDEAVAELTRVLGDDPDNEYALYFLGQAYFEKQDWPRALKAYLRALEVRPEYLGARIGAGHTLRMMNRLDEAVRMGKAALALKKDDADALYLLGVVSFTRGENNEARAYLERFMESGPEAEVALEVTGMLQVLRGETLPYPGADEPEDN